MREVFQRETVIVRYQSDMFKLHREDLYRPLTYEK